MTDEEFAALPPAPSSGSGFGPEPADLDSEAQLLCCCMIDGPGTLAKCRTAGITGSSFLTQRHRFLFRALAKLEHDNSESFEPSAVVLALKANGDFEAVGVPKLTEVSGLVSTTAFVNPLVEKVREFEIRRVLAHLGDSLSERSRNGVTLDDLRLQLASAIPGLDSIARPSESNWPPAVSAAELCAKPPPTPDVLIEAVLYAAGTLLLSGPSKSHKTFTAMDCSIAIASGGTWLGFRTTKLPVLFLNLELQDFATEDRVARISAARGIKPPAGLHLWNLRGRKVTLAELATKLPQMINRTGAKVVVIDPHYKVSSVSGMEENSNDDQGELLTAMERICVLNGAALILTHHFAKGDASSKNAIDRASGGGVFARWGDVMLTLTPHEQDDAMTVEMSLRNFAPVKPFVVRWEYPRWQCDRDLDPADLKTSRGPKEKNSSMNALDALGPGLMGFAEWEKATGMSNTTFKRKRAELIEDGLVEVVGTMYRKTPKNEGL